MGIKRADHIILWVVLGGLFILSVSIGGNFIYWLMVGHVAEIERQQRILLYEVDAEALLAELRHIHSSLGLYRQDPRWHNVPPEFMANPDPEDPNMPPITRSLSPRRVQIHFDHVQLEFGGGDYHFGVRGYLNDDDGSGTKELIPGLWYYAEDGRIPTEP